MQDTVPKAFTRSCTLNAAMLYLILGGLWANMAIAQQPTYIKASNAEASDNFAQSISISGSTLIVGAVREDSNSRRVNGDETDNSRFDAGAAYAFVRSPAGVWAQQAYLKIATATGSSNNLGHAVAISGDTAVVSSPWSSIVGSPGQGAAFVFQRNGTDWCGEIEVAGELVCWQDSLLSSNFEVGDSYGSSTAISGDTIVVGAPLEDSNATGVNGNGSDNSMQWSGAAYVFVHDGNSWIQQAYLKASNTGPNDRFGTSVAISGDIIVVSAVLESSNLTGVNNPAADNDLAVEAGAAYVFVRNAGIWTQQAYLKASNTDASDWFGQSVAVSDNTVVVGARGEDSDANGTDGDGANNNASASGAAYVFSRDEFGNWSQNGYLKASNSGSGDQFGSMVAISGHTLAVSAQFEDSLVTDSGASYVFTRDEIGNWSELAILKASNAGLADRFGGSLAISDELLVAGSWFEDSNATGIDGDENNDLAIWAGAAYAFELNITDVPPRVLLFKLIPESPIAQGSLVEVEGLASDVNRGDRIITGAEYQLDAGPWLPMLAFDGAYDSELEQIHAFIDTTFLELGVHHVCARASDAGGLTSPEVCGDFEVVEFSDNSDFLLSCHHEPLWPQPGDELKIVMDNRKLPLELGDILQLERAEIWFNDNSAPAASRLTLSSNPFVFTVDQLTGQRFTYGCRGVRGDKVVFSGWKTVVIGTPSPSGAIPVAYTGPSSHRIDIVLVADGDTYNGPSDPAFLSDVGLMYRLFFWHELYFQYRHMFNFWIAQTVGTADRESDAGDSPRSLVKPHDWEENYAFAEVGAIIHADTFRNFAEGGMFTSTKGSASIFRHEAGHIPFGLSDEYCCDTGYFEADSWPNVYKTLEACELDAPNLGRQVGDCRSWKSDLNDKTYFTSEPASDSLMERGEDRAHAADIRRFEWLIQQCAAGDC